MLADGAMTVHGNSDVISCMLLFLTMTMMMWSKKV